jgi:hypothetical protein
MKQDSSLLDAAKAISRQDLADMEPRHAVLVERLMRAALTEAAHIPVPPKRTRLAHD